MRTTSWVLASTLLFIAIPSRAQITRDQARSLVQTTLKLRGDKVAARQIQETTNNVPGYYSFGAYNQAQGVQNVVGWFAVNKRTGQVWETSNCDLYQYPALESRRRKLGKHGAKAKQKPPCADGQRAHVVKKRSSRAAAELPEVAQ
jgi:hypothetical protein